MRYLSGGFAFRSITHSDGPVPASSARRSSHGVTGSELAAIRARTARSSMQGNLLLRLPTNHINCLACQIYFPGSSLASLGRGNPKPNDKGKCLCEGFGKYGEKPKRDQSQSSQSFTPPHPWGFLCNCKGSKTGMKT